MSDTRMYCPLRSGARGNELVKGDCMRQECMWWCALNTEQGLEEGCSVEMLATIICCDLGEIKKKVLG